MRHKLLLCDCNRTMKIDTTGIARGLGVNELPRVQSEMCRRHLAAFESAVKSGDDLLVGCTQEAPLFSELHAEMRGAGAIRFVNVRETAGWSEQGQQAGPKMAALAAMADSPEPEPVAAVSYETGRQLLIVGPGAAALAWAERLQGSLSVTVLMTDDGRGAELPAERRYPVISGSVTALSGYLGAFTASWEQRNPIDLDACTRCGACIEVCPEQAIDYNFQIDLDRCKSHRKCVAACGQIGAIDFQRTDTAHVDRFDLVLDLTDAPLIKLPKAPQGYAAPGRDPLEQALAVAQLAQMTGSFEKPKFFEYREKICAHSRSNIAGCTQCVDVCSTGAITSDRAANRVVVEPHLCMGCGGCATVCPSGAMSYAYPRVADAGARMKAGLKAYAAAGGKQPVLLISNNSDGRDKLARLGRQGRGLPANVIPVEVLNVASLGLDLLLGALALGATRIVVMGSESEETEYGAAVIRQMSYGSAILEGLGYAGKRLHWVSAENMKQVEQVLWSLELPAAVPAATFNLSNDKRNTLDFVFDHLLMHAPKPADTVLLPAGAPFGEIRIDIAKCTLCMSCVGACPEGALLDSKETPALRFIERNCVQCGLCERTCPEQAISMVPQLSLVSQAKNPKTINQAEAFACVKCGKPFATKQMVDGMLSRLGKHSMFAEPGALDRIKMCADCRVVDLLHNARHGNINEI